MRCGVVTAYSRACCLVNGKRYTVALIQNALGNIYLVHIIAVSGFCCVCNLRLCICRCDNTPITHLTAHFSIERRFIGYYKALLLCADSVRLALALGYDTDNLRISGKRCIADKLRGLAVKFVCFVAVPATAVLTRVTRCFLLRLHSLVEAFNVNLKTLLLSHFYRKVKREAVGVVELKRFLAGELLLAVLFSLLNVAAENI